MGAMWARGRHEAGVVRGRKALSAASASGWRGLTSAKTEATREWRLASAGARALLAV